MTMEECRKRAEELLPESAFVGAITHNSAVEAVARELFMLHEVLALATATKYDEGVQ